MSSGNFNAGQTQAHAQAKTEQWAESAKNTAAQAHDKAHEMAGNSQAQAQRNRQEDAGILQQTGEKVVNMTQGAIDGVKNTRGMGDKK